MANRKSKVLVHPDSKRIIEDLTNGVPLQEITQYLKKKFRDKRRHISERTLQKFRQKYLKLDSKVVNDIQSIKAKGQEKEIMANIEATSAYQDKINSIADTHLDVANKIIQLDNIIEDRIEYWFNAIKSGEASPSAADKEMRQYMDRQILLLQQYKKFVEGMADKTIDYNVNVTVLNDQIDMIKNVIKEVLVELDPETSILFMEKFNRKLNNIQYNPTKPEKVNVKALNAINAEILED